MKIVHITSAHPTFDGRIFFKECITLLKAGFDVYLVALSCEFTSYNDIKIHALNSKNKLSRWRRLYQIYQLAKKVPADIYHFHDAEFIPFALLLKFAGQKVIYDVHEDTPIESLSFNKHSPLKAAFKYLRWHCLEKIGKLFFDGFICATPHIATKFPPKRTVTVCNYVKVEDFPATTIPYIERSNTALYVGGIMRIRGLEEMVRAISGLSHSYQSQLKLIGRFFPPELEQEVNHLLNVEGVTFLGWIEPSKLFVHFAQAKVGLVILHPEANFKKALPIKLFEYMAAGLPVIASDFPLWRDIILNAKCGFVVDPFDFVAMRDKLKYLFDHPQIAEKMGLAGRKAVSELYNWQSQARLLTDFYQNFGKH